MTVRVYFHFLPSTAQTQKRGGSVRRPFRFQSAPPQIAMNFTTNSAARI